MVLLTTDWQPWFSYGWFADIGVPAFGAVASILVGVGAIVVARQSARIAKQATQREDDAAKRAERRDFGLLATKWLTAVVDEVFHPTIEGLFAEPEQIIPVPDEQRSAVSYKQELDVRAASVGQYSAEMLESTQKRANELGALGTSEGRSLAVLGHRYLLQSIQAWVADPLAWYGMEIEATRGEDNLERLVARIPAGQHPSDDSKRSRTS